MRLDSVRSVKAALVELARIDAGSALIESLNLRDAPEDVRARYASMASTVPYAQGVGLGVAQGRRDGEYALALTAPDEEEAARYLKLAGVKAAEAEVSIVPVIEPRPTAQFLQSFHRPIRPGSQIKPRGKPWVGTLGFFARDQVQGWYGFVSNDHVLGGTEGVAIGTPIYAPNDSDPRWAVGTLARYVARVAGGYENYVDCGFARGDDSADFHRGMNDAAKGLRLRGMRRFTVDDLGREVRKIGRTTEATIGTLRAVEKDGLGVSSLGGIVTYMDQISIMLTGGRFSGPGDSGSAIVIGDALVGLLHAGGPDNRGNDRTYACHAERVCNALSVDPVF